MLAFLIVFAIYFVISSAIYLYLICKFWDVEELYYTLTIPLHFSLVWPVALLFALYSYVQGRKN